MHAFGGGSLESVAHGVLIAAVVAGGIPALHSMSGSLRERTIDVNLLMVLAAVGAVAIGRFEDAAVLLFLFSLSGALESAAMGRAKSAIESLVKLRPQETIRIVDGVQTKIRVEDVLIGDHLLVPPHTALPVDGEVLSGTSSIDQSAMTGESVPVEAGAGVRVIGGTVNQEGMLTIRATSAVGDSTLDRVMALVQEAQDNKAGGERLSQWLGERYTIAVVAIFIVAFVVRFFVMKEALQPALQASLTLLVALSPCALVISVPATTLSALAWCARNGLLVRGGEFIERAGKVQVIAFDKTGTLTRAKPKLVEVCLCQPASVTLGACEGDACWHGTGDLTPQAKSALALVAAAEAHSAHPVAIALVKAAEEQGLTIATATDQEVFAGEGLRAVVNGQDVWVGKPGLLKLDDRELPADFLEHLDSMRSRGMTVAAMRAGDEIAAFGVRDEPRKEAAQVIKELRAQGIRKIAMLTGDNGATAKAVAEPLGIDQVMSDLMPADKEIAVRKLVEENPYVMMVGDGANDAPSLARAYLGLGMGGLGNEAALAASDVVVMRDSLTILPEFLALGRKATGIIRANLLLAGGMVIALTLTSLAGKLPLPLAVIGHEGSTVLVILNGLRLLGGPNLRKSA